MFFLKSNHQETILLWYESDHLANSVFQQIGGADMKLDEEQLLVFSQLI